MLTENERAQLIELDKRDDGRSILVDTRLLCANPDDAAELHYTFIDLHELAERGLVRSEVLAGGGPHAYLGWTITHRGLLALAG